MTSRRRGLLRSGAAAGVAAAWLGASAGGADAGKQIGLRGEDMPVRIELRARDGRELGMRSDFVRGADGAVAWVRTHGRLYRREP